MDINIIENLHLIRSDKIVHHNVKFALRFSLKSLLKCLCFGHLFYGLLHYNVKRPRNRFSISGSGKIVCLLRNVQMDNKAHQVSYSMGTGRSPGVKRPAREPAHSYLPNAKGKNERSYTSIPTPHLGAHRHSVTDMIRERRNGNDPRGRGELGRHPGICSGGLRKATTKVTTAGIPAEIKTVILSVSYPEMLLNVVHLGPGNLSAVLGEAPQRSVVA